MQKSWHRWNLKKSRKLKKHIYHLAIEETLARERMHRAQVVFKRSEKNALKRRQKRKRRAKAIAWHQKVSHYLRLAVVFHLRLGIYIDANCKNYNWMLDSEETENGKESSSGSKSISDSFQLIKAYYWKAADLEVFPNVGTTSYSEFVSSLSFFVKLQKKPIATKTPATHDIHRLADRYTCRVQVDLPREIRTISRCIIECQNYLSPIDNINRMWRLEFFGQVSARQSGITYFRLPFFHFCFPFSDISRGTYLSYLLNVFFNPSSNCFGKLPLEIVRSIFKAVCVQN